MKKIFALMSAAVLALGFTACSSDAEETIEGGVSKQLKLNITVSNLDEEAGTRAIKTGWVSGDKLNIWFDATNTANPDLILTYNGSEWTAGDLNKEPNASGNLIVLYEGYNDWSKYTHNNAYMFTTEQATISGLVFAQPIAYTGRRVNSFPYTYESNTLTANLTDWKCLTKIQVVVTGLDAGNASNYALKETHMKRGVVYFGSQSLDYSNASENTYTLGVSNADGVAFYFFTHTNTGSDWTFTLKDISADTEKTYSVSGKTLDVSSKIQGIKIAASKFE